MTNRSAPRTARRAHRELPGRAGSAPADEQREDTSAAGAPATEDDIVLYTPAQAAALLAVKESWLRRKAGQRAIPCTFVGKHLRFPPTTSGPSPRSARNPWPPTTTRPASVGGVCVPRTGDLQKARFPLPVQGSVHTPVTP
jgi:excisionase family DNA binding protein